MTGRRPGVSRIAEMVRGSDHTNSAGGRSVSAGERIQCKSARLHVTPVLPIDLYMCFRIKYKAALLHSEVRLRRSALYGLTTRQEPSCTAQGCEKSPAPTAEAGNGAQNVSRGA